MQDRTECRDPTPPYSHLLDTTTLYPPYYIVQFVYPLAYSVLHSLPGYWYSYSHGLWLPAISHTDVTAAFYWKTPRRIYPDTAATAHCLYDQISAKYNIPIPNAVVGCDLDLLLTWIRRYGPLRKNSSSFCEGFWPLAKAFFLSFGRQFF